MIRTIIKKGAYYDSVTLMNVAKQLNALKGVEDSAVVMATKENKGIIKASGLLTAEIQKAGDNDLSIAVRVSSAAVAIEAMHTAHELLKTKVLPEKSGGGQKSASLDKALEDLGGANLAIISVAGRFAAQAAADCLEKGLNVMLFSDNVSIADEIALKKTALEKGLLVMGPDCGTAIINGAPLAFANSVRRGNIGIAAASGTGLQEVSTLISNEGAGISQAIGAGSRDVKLEVGALTLTAALKALAADKATSVILIVSKPPHPLALKKLYAEIKKIKKPVAAVFLGGQAAKTVKPVRVKPGFYSASTLEEAAFKAVCLAMGESLARAKERICNINLQAEKLAAEESVKKTGAHKYLRGLFSGGTFVSEAQVVLPEFIAELWSNAPLDKKFKLANSMALKGNSVIDLGEDEFTVGRPHPMIDYSLRNKMIVSEALRSEVSVILLDVVLGYGSNLCPLEDITPAIKKAFKANPGISVVASVTGTETDPQVRSRVVKGLLGQGVIVMPSNASACRLAGRIVQLGNRG